MPLDKDIEDVFSTTKNKAFRFGEATRWVALSDDDQPLGRIAAFVNKKYKNKGDEGQVGGIGFFECVNDQNVADLLFDCAKHWLIQHGVEAMDGPINFGERDRWWGLVTEGHHPPLYCMNYNPPYYINLFEDYGFQPFYNQICFGMHPKKKLSEKVYERHQAFSKDKDFHAEHLQKNNLAKYAKHFASVYNKAWAGHGGLKQIAEEQVNIMFNKMKPVMDEETIWFAYYKNEPIAIFTCLPDINQWFKHLNGKFGLMQKLKFLWVKKYVPCTKVVGLVFGVVPEWQGKGVDAYLIGEAATRFFQCERSPYVDFEMQWIGDFNPKMINVAENIGDSYRTRVLTTYRYNFDRTKPFERHPIL